MDQLTAAVFARFENDTNLTTTKGVVTTQGRLGQDPKLLVRPHLVFKLFGGPRAAGGSGASVTAYLETKVWGYEDNELARLPACLAAAERVSQLMLTRFIIAGGGTAMPGESPGWQQVEDTDPQTVHLHNGFHIRYWSAARVAVLAS